MIARMEGSTHFYESKNIDIYRITEDVIKLVSENGATHIFEDESSRQYNLLTCLFSDTVFNHLGLNIIIRRDICGVAVSVSRCYQYELATAQIYKIGDIPVPSPNVEYIKRLGDKFNEINSKIEELILNYYQK